MKYLLSLILLLTLMAGFGCSGGGGSDSGTDAAPKGAPPNTIEAPPGAKNPEERAKEEMGNPGSQDGSGN